MRFYVHHDVAPEFTLAVEWNITDARTIADLRKEFASAFSATTGVLVYASEFNISMTDDGPTLPLSTCVTCVVTAGADLFAKRGPPVSSPNAAPSLSAQAENREKQAELNKRLTSALKQAEKAWGEKNYRKARALYSEYIELVQENHMLDKLNPKNALAIRRIGEIELLNGRPEKALPFLERAQLSAPSSVEAHLKLAECHVALDDIAEAVSEFQTALKCVSGEPGSKRVQQEEKRIKLQLGTALFRSGERATGGQLLTQLLQEDMDDPAALLAYGEAALELGQVDDALKIFLRLIVAKSEDETIRRFLARSLIAPSGLEMLRTHLPDQESSAAALAFLATVTKEHSGVDVAIDIYEQVTRLSPATASYALNLTHVIELKLDYPKALSSIRCFLNANSTRQLAGVSCADFLAALPSCVDAEPRLVSPDTPCAVVSAFPPGAGCDSDKLQTKPAGTYGSDELDLLALFFTAVKERVIFVAGALDSLPGLVNIVEPLRAVKDLHLTLVRNENAYYCCVAQLATSIPLPLPSHPFIYFAGDSHTLAPSWRTVEYMGKPHLIRPILVTGCKIWHLRRESDFFPRYNFQAAIASIPNGSHVVFCFGEIDCREGLLVAIERCRYDTLQEGAEKTVSIYISRLKEVVKEKGFRVMVHPVPPVLNETRHIVKIFNQALKTAVMAEPQLMYLDFFDQLLSSDGEKLADGLALDGTHLHPDYVKFMEKAFARP